MGLPSKPVSIISFLLYAWFWFKLNSFSNILIAKRKLIEIHDTSRGLQVDAIELYDLEYPCKVAFCPETEEAFVLGKFLQYMKFNPISTF